MIARLQFEVDRLEVYTGLRPTRLLVSPVVLSAYLQELTGSQIASGATRAEFNGYPVESDPKLPIGAVIVDSERGPAYPLGPPRPKPSRSAGEASPRPWRVSESEPRLIVDADGRTVTDGGWRKTHDLAAANAALIVAAVNAVWERERRISRMNQAMVEAVCLTPDCVLPAGHGERCQIARPPDLAGARRRIESYEFPAGPPKEPTTAAHDREWSGQTDGCRTPQCKRVLGHAGPHCNRDLRHPGPCTLFYGVSTAVMLSQAMRHFVGGHTPNAPPTAGVPPVCALPGNHSGPCVPERSDPHTFAVDDPAAMEAMAPGQVRSAPLSADCRLPLLHQPGCICAALLRP